MDDYHDAWMKLRRQVRREQRRYEGRGTNQEGRVVAASLSAAYGGVLRMMDKIEASAAVRGS